jgi:hypothetical protein
MVLLLSTDITHRIVSNITVKALSRAALLKTSSTPSSWFRTTSTVYSSDKLASLLHLATGYGVRRVSNFAASDCQGEQVS